MPPGDVFVFGPFQLDSGTRRLLRDGESVALAGRQFDLLHTLVSRAGRILPKDLLIEAAWHDVAVTDNSLEQAISTLRKTLGSSAGEQYIETLARRGYRFAADVARVPARETDAALDALLAPHRAWLDGRAALETLERDQIFRACAVFEGVLHDVPDQASAHVGLANAFAMQFETTRSDLSPDVSSLARALHHAREACRLDPSYGEGWATLGFVLERTGHEHHGDALAASRRAVGLEPDNWRHRLRLSSISWGEERLREARRTLSLLPGFPLAHWLAASVHVARQALSDAERELVAGIRSEASHADDRSRFSGVALHWLLGLILLDGGDEARALDEFERELALESSGHLYARECCANTWYAIGALRFGQRRFDEAAHAFALALERVPVHVMARLGIHLLPPAARPTTPLTVNLESGSARSFDRQLAHATRLVHEGAMAEGARALELALSPADAGSAGWLIPIEPLLRLPADSDLWAGVLARLRMRAA